MDDYTIAVQFSFEADSPEEAAGLLREYWNCEKSIYVDVRNEATGEVTEHAA